MKRLICALGAVVCVLWGAWSVSYLVDHGHKQADFSSPQMYFCMGGAVAFILFAVFTAPIWLFPIFEAIDRWWDRIPE